LIIHLMSPNARVERVPLDDGSTGFVLAFDDLILAPSVPGGPPVARPSGVTVRIGPMDGPGLANLAAAYAAEAETESPVERPRLVVPAVGMNRAERRRAGRP
jgi:hypothetical protein